MSSRNSSDDLPGRLGEAADLIRDRATIVRDCAAGLSWHSPAARAAGTALTELLRCAHSTAEQIEGTAAAVRRHHRAVADASHHLTDPAVGLVDLCEGLG